MVNFAYETLFVLKKMTTLGLTAESRELDDLVDDKPKPQVVEEVNHEWLKTYVNFYASHRKSTKIIKTAAAILACSSMVRCTDVLIIKCV